MATYHVLIADDDHAMSQMLARFARSEGLVPTTVADGSEAVRALDENPFDLVLSDIDMPGLSGIELLEAVRTRDLDLPVILITGAPRMETAIAAVEYGANHYLTKPVELDHLRHVVERAIQSRIFARARRPLGMLAESGGLQIGDLAGLGVRFDRALERVFLHYQPIVRWSDRSTFAYEALVRSDEETIRSPDALFDAADRLGRTSEIGRRVRTTFGEMGAQPNGTLFFVNLHTHDLADEALYDPNSALSRIASAVVLEITERARLESVPQVRTRIGRLREMGFRIAIDDIGAGYAGLTSFASLEPDFMKLDRGLVEGIDGSRTKHQLVGAMVHACHELGVEALAEGVETSAERDALVTLGCDLFQGFLFARPDLPFVDPAF